MKPFEQEIAVLQKKLDEICKKNPCARGSVFFRTSTKEIVVSFFYFYDNAKHKDRGFTECGCTYLSRVTVQENEFINALVTNLAGKEFTVMLDRFDDGILTYVLTPKA